MIDEILKAGVVGAGGAGFPTHVKLNAKAQTVIVNGAECEPLLRVDQQLMALYADQLLYALDQCVKETGAKSGVIALKGKYKEAIHKLEEKLPVYENLSLHILQNVYPAGDEQYIVYEVTGRIVPEGGIPLMVGAVVINVETLLNIYKALTEQEAVTEKYLTVAGAVKNPRTMRVPVGISVREVIDLAGGAATENFKVIDGGPSMGKMLGSVESPVMKNSKGYVVLPAKHPLVINKEKSLDLILKEAKTSCCHCDLCTDVCPRYLLGHKLHPSKLMRIASYASMGEQSSTLDEAFLCCECGLCEQACIMNLQPWKLNIHLKKELTAMGIKNENKRAPEEAHPFRGYRGFPVKKLVYRLELDPWDVEAPLEDKLVEAKKVTLLSKEHLGAPGVLMVQKGDRVEKGQLLYAAKEGALSAHVHASITGRVESADDHKVVITAE